jgi:hypothetical protein
VKTKIHSRRIAWLALLAMLFSAASPTLAAAVLEHEPAALGQMLGLPAAPAAAADESDAAEHAHHHAAHTSDGSDDGHDAPAHAKHGIYCSFCLNPSSVATIAAAPAVVCVLSLSFDLAAPSASSPHVPSVITHYRSRAPPLVS